MFYSLQDTFLPQTHILMKGERDSLPISPLSTNMPWTTPLLPLLYSLPGNCCCPAVTAVPGISTGANLCLKVTGWCRSTDSKNTTVLHPPRCASGSSGSAIPNTTLTSGTEQTQVLQLTKKPLSNSTAPCRSSTLLAFQHSISLGILAQLHETFPSAVLAAQVRKGKWEDGCSWHLTILQGLAIQICIRFLVLKQLIANKLIYTSPWDPVK